MASFGRRSTAEEVSEGIDLEGRHAIVTGANTGIGLETARVLALRGCEVTMACRDLDKAGSGRQRILSESAGAIEPEQLRVEELDLASLDSVRDFAQGTLASDRPIHLLINNAGVMLPDRRTTRDGFEAHFGINHLGHFLLTRLLEDRIRESAPARVVMVSSSAMQFAALTPELEDLDWQTRKWSGWRAYGSSKLMNLLFANELNRRFAGDGVVANTLHPGIVKTELARDQSGWMVGLGLFMLPFMKQVDRGAATTLLVATSPEYADRGGEYLEDCALARAPKAGADRNLAADLWKRSEQLTGL
jgi:NAD(P)-dependent dehydrogenase (short-subunit alcohol dehydrogenase family)